MTHASETDGTTVAITDNDPITLKALETILGRDFSVLWTELTGKATIIRCVEDRQIPDVLLIDMALSDMSGLSACRSLRANLGIMPILAITSYPLPVFAAQAAEHGAQGIIGKENIRDIIQAIPRLTDGAVPPAPAQCRNVTFRSAANSHRDMLHNSLPDDMTLAPREIEILELILQGLDQRQVSRQLEISAATVRTYTRRIREKLHCSTLEQAAARWVTLRYDYPQFRHKD